MSFTPEELAEMARADAEIEREFMITSEEREAGNRRDRLSKMEKILFIILPQFKLRKMKLKNFLAIFRKAVYNNDLSRHDKCRV